MLENSFMYSFIETSKAFSFPYRTYVKQNKYCLEKMKKVYGLKGPVLLNSMIASLDICERISRDYPKPEFGIKEVLVNNNTYKIKEKILIKKAFCKLIHFEKENCKENLPKMLAIAPMAGHHATLLRNTVEELLPFFDIYITDWQDARNVPLSEGPFDLDDYIQYLIDFSKYLGRDLHILAVCQPTVPALVATAIMAEDELPYQPKSMILIGGPVDTRINPTEVNDFATSKNISWFESNLITRVPITYSGFGRAVYPGFLQLSGFISMNLHKHILSHLELFKEIVFEEEALAEKQKKFYDEYLSVMDLPAEFYLQTVKKVFLDFDLARGRFIWKGRIIKTEAIKNSAILGIEGENDDIAGVGQTKAALNLCKNVSNNLKEYLLQPGVGHYGIFSGSKFKKFIVPVIRDFCYKVDKELK